MAALDDLESPSPPRRLHEAPLAEALDLAPPVRVGSAGALLHVDTKQLARFDRPGHLAHGDHSEEHRARGAGYVFAHCVIDDRTRLAYVELHPDQQGPTCAAVLGRAAARMRDEGCGPVQAVTSNNALAYVRSRDFADARDDIGASHILIPPRTPRWNGKVERFIRTLDQEWAHGRVWPHPTSAPVPFSSWMR